MSTQHRTPCERTDDIVNTQQSGNERANKQTNKQTNEQTNKQANILTQKQIRIQSL